jgi:hypothetical protein
MDLDKRRIELEEKKLEAEILRYKVLLAQAHGGGSSRGEDF